jgi:peptidoglycan/LPS O-acetylase OafA/YrhL
VAWIDWLRVLALLGVFVIHVGEVFNPWDRWHVTNDVRSRVVGEAVVIMAPWIMPLFMLLTGTSAWYSLAHRTNGQYLRERVTRVLVPLLAGIVLLVPPQVWAERRWRGQFDGSLAAFYPHAFSGGIYPAGNLSWHHLWFLAHLFVYAIVTLPLFRFWQTDRGRAQLRRLARWCAHPAGLLWLAVPLVVERHLAWSLLAHHGLFVSDWSDQTMLLVAYAYGFALAAEPGLGRDIDRQWPWALGYGAASVATLMWLAWIGVVPTRLPPTSVEGSLAFWTLYAVGAWACVIALLGLGRRFLRAETPLLAFGRRAGYGWYLLHQPVIVLVAAWVVTWSAGVAAKLFAITVASLVGTLAATTLLLHGGEAWTAARRGIARRRHTALHAPPPLT